MQNVHPQFASPSLTSVGSRQRAYELKYLLVASLAAEVESHLRWRMEVDPHGDPALDGAYRTTTLYFDTPELDVYHRSRWYRRRKLRLRRYGELPWAFVERKSKSGDRVAKLRTSIDQSDIALLSQPLAAEQWPGSWFHKSMIRRRLRPACRVSYVRTALVGHGEQGPLRATFDRDLRGELASDDWRLSPCDLGHLLTPGRVIFELKFHTAMPQPFRELVQRFALNPAIVSKYRACRDAWGAHGRPPATAEVACA